MKQEILLRHAGLSLAVFVFGTLPAFAQVPVMPIGAGTLSDPYLISEIGHLVWMGAQAGASSAVYHKLIHDIDAAATSAWNDSGTDADINEGFEPIGTRRQPFQGVLDGQGFKIRNLNIHRPSQDYTGLFGCIGSRGVVKNLGLESGLVLGRSRVGGLSGANSGTITNCHATGNVIGLENVGGLMGENRGGTVLDSYAAGAVMGEQSVGGLTGANLGAITKSYATGPVKGTWWCGGLIGQNFKGSVAQCDAIGAVTGEWDTGGLIGENFNGTVLYCRAGGTVVGEDQCGGLVGNNDAGGKITQSHASGVVAGTGDYVGGLAGDNLAGGKISQCYATSPVTGGLCTGGLVGYNGHNYPTNCVITQCYAAGAVTSIYELDPKHAGGLVGRNHNGQLNSNVSYNSLVTASYWDAQKGGWLESTNGLGKTTAEMMQQATFAGWDFSTVWSIAEGSGYPSLLSAPPLSNASPQPPFALNVVVKGSGTVVLSPQKDAYSPGEIVTLTALAAAGDYEFGGWNGMGVSNALADIVTVVMDNHKVMVATFQQVHRISTVQELQKIGNDPAYPLDGHYWLTQDIEAGAVTGFAPIGTPMTGPFTGVFDGQGHVIRNLFINWTNAVDAGIFGNIGAGGVVRNLGVEGGGVAGKERVGGLAGSNYGMVTNCYTTSAITGHWSVGGLIGLNYGPVQDCHTTGEVSGDDKTGGLIGRNEAGAVTHCFSTARLACNEESQFTGGLIGWNNGGSVTDCYVTGQVGGGSYAGGLMGENWGGIIQQCHATNMVLNGGFVAGGLIAFNDGGPIEQCSAAGVISGKDSIGGLAGMNNQGAITTCSAEVTLTGDNEAGGLLGFNLLGTVEQCATAGSVLGKQEVGGLIGANSGGTITNCHTSGQVNGEKKVGGVVGYNTGTATQCHSTGQVTGIENIGGLVGENWKGPVAECYSTGAVNGQHTLGGLIGLNLGTITHSHAEGKVTGSWWCGGVVGHNFKGEISHAYATGPISAEWEAGGLAGESFFGVIQQCGAMSLVTGDYVTGGLIGDNDGGLITQSYAVGAVSGGSTAGGLAGENVSGGIIAQCYATCPVFGFASIGGLVGINGDDFSHSVITECYAIGVIDGTAAPAGGLVAINHFNPYSARFQRGGFIESSYWDVETAAVSASTNGLSKTTLQMKQRETYANWDFTNVWSLADGKSYPQLKWAPAPLTLNVASKGPGTVNISPRKDAYSAGETVTLTATTDAGNYEFVRWRGAGIADPSALTTTIPVDIQKTVVAVFRTVREISSLDDLAKIGRDPAYPLDGRYWLARDIDAAATAGWNDADTDESVKEGFTPIGNDVAPFTGVFLGKDHVIRNLTINRGTENFVGLFGSIGPSSVVNGTRLANVTVVGMECVGGLVGDNWGGTITHCHVGGRVVGNGVIGGLVGINHFTIAQCSTIGSVEGITNVFSGRNIGGVVGWGDHDRISQCYSASLISGGAGVGGLLGNGDHSTVAQSYSFSSVKGIPYLNGNIGMGGLVGGAGFCTITQCYSTGRVIIEQKYPWYFGGLVGYTNFSEVADSFWDIQTSGMTNSNGGIGKTTTEMMAKETYINWDFNTVWGMDAAKNNGYPFLRVFDSPGIVMPPGLPESEIPLYRDWIANHLAAWGKGEFSQVPAGDFVAAYLVNTMPVQGLTATVDFRLGRLALGDDGMEIGLALKTGAVAKDGAINGWLVLEGCNEFSKGWGIVMARDLNKDMITFTNGAASVICPRTAYRFFRARTAVSDGNN